MSSTSSSSASSSSSSSSSSSQEFIVRVPREINKKFNVMRFNSALNVEPNKWKTCQMVRENELKEVKQDNNDLEFIEFGAGSEFGRKQREEARRKKYTRRPNTTQQPWILKTSGKNAKKYKGLREGGVSENASYYVFFQAPDGAFEAFPVKEWYNFTPIQRYKALTAEEAEEKFEKRDKILNYFSVMINKKRKDEEMSENSKESKAKIKKELKVSDMDEWHGMDSDNERSDMEGRSDEDVKPKLKNKKKDAKPKKKSSKSKKKGSDDDDNDSEPQEESDEGDFDDKEVDYMSDSSDDSEESETEKIDKEMKSVVDEDALRQLVLSEDEDEEEDKTEDKEKDGEKTEKDDKKSTDGEKKSKFKDKLTANFDSPPPSSSDSDSDDPDSVDIKKSALLAPVKQESDKSSRGSSRSATPTANLDSSGGNGTNDSNKLKRKISSHDSPNIKKSKLSTDNSDGITEDAVRRYLMRKPMTCTDLLQKFKNKVSFKGDLVHTIAQILKRLNPEKQTIKNKLYFSLKP